jgi:hypothetical protein
MQFSFVPTDGPQVRSALELMQRRLDECSLALERLEMRVSQIEEERIRIGLLLSRFESMTVGWTGPLTGHLELDFELLELVRLAVHLLEKELMQSSPDSGRAPTGDQIAFERENGSLRDRLAKAVAVEDEEDSVSKIIQLVREGGPVDS